MNETSFWQWVATGAIGFLSFIATIFTGSQMKRVGRIEERSNDAIPRKEYREDLQILHAKIDSLHKLIRDEFRDMRSSGT